MKKPTNKPFNSLKIFMTSLMVFGTLKAQPGFSEREGSRESRMHRIVRISLSAPETVELAQIEGNHLGEVLTVATVNTGESQDLNSPVFVDATKSHITFSQREINIFVKATIPDQKDKTQPYLWLINDDILNDLEDNPEIYELQLKLSLHKSWPTERLTVTLKKL